jgi:hypothetical protein
MSVYNDVYILGGEDFGDTILQPLWAAPAVGHAHPPAPELQYFGSGEKSTHLRWIHIAVNAVKWPSLQVFDHLRGDHVSGMQHHVYSPKIPLADLPQSRGDAAEMGVGQDADP